MKFCCLLFAFLMMVLPALAAEPTGQAEGQVEKRPQQEGQKKSAQQQAKGKAQPPVHKQFHPTERIKADTVIAFPADI